MIIKTLADLRAWVANNSGLPGSAKVEVDGFGSSPLEFSYQPNNALIVIDPIGEDPDEPDEPRGREYACEVCGLDDCECGYRSRDEDPDENDGSDLETLMDDLVDYEREYEREYGPPLEEHPGYPHSGLMSAGEY